MPRQPLTGKALQSKRFAGRCLFLAALFELHPDAFRHFCNEAQANYRALQQATHPADAREARCATTSRLGRRVQRPGRTPAAPARRAELGVSGCVDPRAERREACGRKVSPACGSWTLLLAWGLFAAVHLGLFDGSGLNSRQPSAPDERHLISVIRGRCFARPTTTGTTTRRFAEMPAGWRGAFRAR